jgi:thymidylate synthase (FAD)
MGNVFEVLENCNDYEDNLDLIKRIIKRGHKSIMEHDYLVFAIVDVSPIVEQTIIGNRLTSFTIKSRRMVDFRSVGYYVPEFRSKDGNIHSQNSELQEMYKKHMQYLFDQYGYFVDNGINVEDARFVLPYSYHSNIIMGMDARELERLIIFLLYGKQSNIAELKELGEKLFEIVKKQVPYLVDSIEKYKSNHEEFVDLNNLTEEYNLISEILDKDNTPEMIEYPEDTDEKILLSFLMGKYQCSETIATKLLRKLGSEDQSFSENLMKYIALKDENRELEQVNFQFQIPISLAILTHLTRHRMHSLITPDFVPMWDLKNYTMPESIRKFDSERYDQVFSVNQAIFDFFKTQGVMEEDLVYFYLSGQMCNVLTTMNGKTLLWISRLRCCNKAQWQIRDIFKDIVEQVKEVAPLYGQYLGKSCEVLGKCPEEKDSCKIKINSK